MIPESVNTFELFSLRMARLLLVCSIAAGSAAIVLGLLAAGGAWLLPGPTRAQVPSPPTPKMMTRDAAQQWATEHSSNVREVEQAALLLDDPGILPASMSSLFPDPPYNAADVWEEFCRVPSDYGCLQRGKRIKRPCAARTFTALFRGVDESRRDELLGILAEHLPAVSVEKRLSMVVPILMAYIQIQQHNKDEVDAHLAKVREIDETFAVQSAAHSAKQSAISIAGLTAAGWGLGAVISASLFVALLAIERHLRALRQARDKLS